MANTARKQLSESLALPALEPLDLEAIGPESTLIFATGFEKRSLTLANLIHKRKQKLRSCVLVEYEPQHEGNLVAEARNISKRLLPQGTNISSLKYTRFYPDIFLDELEALLRRQPIGEHVVIDISAMSKFLILLVLSTLLRTKTRITIVYTEARSYHPTQPEFRSALKKESTSVSDILTMGVHRIISTHRVSSVGMLGAPIVLVAFPTFNKSDVVAVLNEIPFQKVILLEEKSEDAKNRWRQTAIRTLNEGIKEIVSERTATSVLDYRETLDVLAGIARAHGTACQITISPTGSKMQTIGTALFREYFPEVQFVYPPTTQFRGPLSNGVGRALMLNLGNTTNLVSMLHKARVAEETSEIDAALNR